MVDQQFLGQEIFGFYCGHTDLQRQKRPFAFTLCCHSPLSTDQGDHPTPSGQLQFGLCCARCGPGFDEKTPLHIAAENGNTELLKLLAWRHNHLTEYLSTQDKDSMTALDLARRRSHEDTADELIKLGA